jgi:rSAM/selenodomain-associated transferase 1
MGGIRAVGTGVTSLSPRPQPRAAVLVLARWWASGPVKTRLAAEIGEAAARAAYRALAEQVWRGLAHPVLARHLWTTPPERRVDAGKWLHGAERLETQAEGDLGARLVAAFDAALTGGAPWAAAVGTDAPEVDAAMVLQAGAALAAADVAVVPALDGGYALIALRAPEPRLFDGIPWSTPEVLSATRARAAQLRLRVALLEPVADVDNFDDLKRAAARFPSIWPATPPAPRT